MDKKYLEPLCGKKVKITLKDGFYTTIILPNIIDDVISANDKFGQPILISVDSIAVVREVM